MLDSRWSAVAMHSSAVFGSCRNYRPDDACGEIRIHCCGGCESPDTVENSDAEALRDTAWVADCSVARIHGTLFWSSGILRLTFLYSFVERQLVTRY